MIVTVRSDSDAAEVSRALAARGLWVRPLHDGTQRHFLIEPFSQQIHADELRALPGVAAVASAPSPHPQLDKQPKQVAVSGVAIGPGAEPVLMAGPCSVESQAQIEESAAAVRAHGATFLRGGAFKPRTSPYAFQGHGAQALGWLRRAADAHGMRVVSEAMSEEDVPLVAEHAHLVQIGSRNMQNFALLRKVGKTGRPVLLKRGMSSTVEEWLLAAEHLLAHGAGGVVLCERGLRGFDPSTRNLLDLGAVALLAHVKGLPVVVDPSHAAGRRDLIAPLARAALAAGAAGLLIEVHPQPEKALSDGPQALLPSELGQLVRDLAPKGPRHAD